MYEIQYKIWRAQKRAGTNISNFQRHYVRSLLNQTFKSNVTKSLTSLPLLSVGILLLGMGVSGCGDALLCVDTVMSDQGERWRNKNVDQGDSGVQGPSESQKSSGLIPRILSRVCGNHDVGMQSCNLQNNTCPYYPFTGWRHGGLTFYLSAGNGIPLQLDNRFRVRRGFVVQTKQYLSRMKLLLRK